MPNGADVMAAIPTLHMRFVGRIVIKSEAVSAALTAIEFDAHRGAIPPTARMFKDGCLSGTIPFSCRAGGLVVRVQFLLTVLH